MSNITNDELRSKLTTYLQKYYPDDDINESVTTVMLNVMGYASKLGRDINIIEIYKELRALDSPDAMSKWFNEYILGDKINKKIILDSKFHNKLLLNKRKPFGYKKITGTALGDILMVDSFKSEFAAYARLCGLQMPILDPKYINAGVILEPKILEKVEQSLGEKLKRFNAQEYQYDYFKENEIFGGLPDGYAESRKKIIEIKTTNEKNYEY